MPVRTQADFMCHYNDTQLKYINDCQLMSNCTFKVPINSNCQGLVCFCNSIFYFVIRTEHDTCYELALNRVACKSQYARYHIFQFYQLMDDDDFSVWILFESLESFCLVF